MRLYVLCAMTLAACAFEPTGGPGEPEDPGQPDPGVVPDVDAGVVEQPPDNPPPPDPPPPPPPEPPTLTCRIDGENLGIVGAKVEAGSNRTYTFEQWQTNAAGAIVGFTLSGPANNLRYEVRAGDERHMGDTLVYEGNERISRVDFCVSFGGD